MKYSDKGISFSGTGIQHVFASDLKLSADLRRREGNLTLRSQSADARGDFLGFEHLPVNVAENLTQRTEGRRMKEEGEDRRPKTEAVSDQPSAVSSPRFRGVS
jgi:hypothetical protein